jgi:hypothetical protein
MAAPGMMAYDNLAPARAFNTETIRAPLDPFSIDRVRSVIINDEGKRVRGQSPAAYGRGRRDLFKCRETD